MIARPRIHDCAVTIYESSQADDGTPVSAGSAARELADIYVVVQLDLVVASLPRQMAA